jgi:hypothetical protein
MTNDTSHNVAAGVDFALTESLPRFVAGESACAEMKALIVRSAHPKSGLPDFGCRASILRDASPRGRAPLDEVRSFHMPESGRPGNPGNAEGYWFPAFAGMTPENRHVPYRFHSGAHANRTSEP